MTRPFRSRLPLLLALPLTLAACDEAARQGLGLARPAAEAPAAPAPPPLSSLTPPAVSPLQAPIETGAAAPAPVATVEPETYAVAAWVARGNEPFWRAEVAGGSLRYTTPERPGGRTIAVRRLAFATGVEFVGELGGAAFALTIRPADCTDDMSGEPFPATATLRVGSRVTGGCAAPGAPAADPAPAAAAPTAAAVTAPASEG